MELQTEIRFEGQIKLSLNESEARALHAMTLYGAEPFLKVFYEKLGESALKPHEKGFKTLFEGIRVTMGKHLKQIDDAISLLKSTPNNK